MSPRLSTVASFPKSIILGSVIIELFLHIETSTRHNSSLSLLWAPKDILAFLFVTYFLKWLLICQQYSQYQYTEDNLTDAVSVVCYQDIQRYLPYKIHYANARIQNHNFTSLKLIYFLYFYQFFLTKLFKTNEWNNVDYFYLIC